MQQTRPGRIRLLGVEIEDITEDEAVARIVGYIAGGAPHQVVTINPEFLIEARHNAPFQQVLADAALATPDGIGLLLAARWRGTPLRSRVTGADLTSRLAAEAAARGWRLFLLGAGPGVAEQAAAILQQRNPQLCVVGYYAGSPQPSEEQAIVARVRAAQPDLLLVAYGTPAQELWIGRNLQHLAVPVVVGVGGAFDFIAGVVPRAPRWMRQLGIEWLFRLVRQPWRWRRIINAVPRFLWAVLREPRG